MFQWKLFPTLLDFFNTFQVPSVLNLKSSSSAVLNCVLLYQWELVLLSSIWSLRQKAKTHRSVC